MSSLYLRNPPQRPLIGADAKPLEMPEVNLKGVKIPSWIAASAAFIAMVFAIATLAYVVKNPGDCTCPDTNVTSSLSNEIISSITDSSDIHNQRIYDTLQTILVDSPETLSCSNRCYDRYFSCLTRKDKEKCTHESAILRDCGGFNRCLSECRSTCSNPDRDIAKGAQCINSYNLNMICPKSR